MNSTISIAPTIASDHSSPKTPRLLDRVRGLIRARHYSLRTEQTYLHWIKRFIIFHGKRHPAKMGAPEVEAFLSDLAVRLNVAANTQNLALSAILFLYRDVLEIQLPWLEDVTRAKKPQRLPTVLSRAEATRLLEALPDDVPGLIARLLYGSGMRLMEGVRLRVKDLDVDGRQIMVRDGKGAKDRVTMLPDTLAAPLMAHLAVRRAMYQRDREYGRASVYLPDALARKYPAAAEAWHWQYVFAASGFSTDPRSGETRSVFEGVNSKFGQLLNSVQSVGAAFAPVLAQVGAAMRAMPPRLEAAVAAMARHGWYVDGGHDLHELEIFRNLIDSGDTSKVDDLLMSHFEGRLDAIEDALVTVLPRREKILRQAFAAHRQGDYELSIPVLLIQADGACVDLTDHHFFQKLRGGQVPEVAAHIAATQTPGSAMFLGPISLELPINASERARERIAAERGWPAWKELNRHQVLHGESVSRLRHPTQQPEGDLVAELPGELSAWHRPGRCGQRCLGRVMRNGLLAVLAGDPRRQGGAAGCLWSSHAWPLDLPPSGRSSKRRVMSCCQRSA